MTLKYAVHSPAHSPATWTRAALAAACSLAAVASAQTQTQTAQTPLLQPLPTVQPRLLEPIKPVAPITPISPNAPTAPALTRPTLPASAPAMALPSPVPQPTTMPPTVTQPAATLPAPTLPAQSQPVPSPQVQAQPLPPQPAPPTVVEEVPFITTPDRVTLAMLKLADVTKRDHVIDLGSGDGRIVITAAKRFGATGLGVEIDPRLVERSRLNARQAGVEAKTEFREQDLFKTDLRPATVVTMYLLPEVNLQLRPNLLALKPGTRLVSHDWDMGDWPPDRTVTLDVPDKAIGREKSSRVHLWVVPAPVGGLWCGSGGRQLQLAQTYQRVQAKVEVPGLPAERQRRSRQRGKAASAAVDGSAPAAASQTSTLMWGQLNGTELLMTNTSLSTVGAMRLDVKGTEMKVADARGTWAKWQRQVLRRAEGKQCPV